MPRPGPPLLREPHRAQRKQPLIRGSRGREGQRVRVGGQQGSPICFLRDAPTDPTVEEHIVFNTRTCVWLHVSAAVTAIMVTFDCAIVICLLI